MGKTGAGQMKMRRIRMVDGRQQPSVMGSLPEIDDMAGRTLGDDLGERNRGIDRIRGQRMDAVRAQPPRDVVVAERADAPAPFRIAQLNQPHHCRSPSPARPILPGGVAAGDQPGLPLLTLPSDWSYIAHFHRDHSLDLRRSDASPHLSE